MLFDKSTEDSQVISFLEDLRRKWVSWRLKFWGGGSKILWQFCEISIFLNFYLRRGCKFAITWLKRHIQRNFLFHFIEELIHKNALLVLISKDILLNTLLLKDILSNKQFLNEFLIGQGFLNMMYVLSKLTILLLQPFNKDWKSYSNQFQQVA